MKNPYFTVAICTYNSQGSVNATIQSIISQIYPNDDYEIVVVNDGSTDNTQNILNNYKKIHVITNNENKGIGYSRNMALNNSKGAILSFIDDDCVADKYWLSELHKAFIDENVIAVGGKVKICGSRLINQYLKDSGYGQPYFEIKHSKKRILGRLLYYLKKNFQSDNISDRIVEVGEIYTANASYRKSCAISVGGFDKSLRSAEDSDISFRLKQRFNQGHILYQPHAVVSHIDEFSIIHHLLNKFINSRELVKYYNKINKPPPIPPSPFITLILILVFMTGNTGKIYSFYSPIIVYCWWMKKFFYSYKIKFLLYPYIQFFEEFIVTVGIVYFNYLTITQNDFNRNNSKE